MFGYHVPTAVLIIIALVGLSALLRNAWPAVVGGMMLFSYFFLLRFD